MEHLRILLIDDHTLFRTGLRLVLAEGFAGVDVLQAASLEQALHTCAVPPHLVLLDIQLQGVNGLEGLGLLKARWPIVPVVMLSSLTDPETVRLALARGAAAYVSKADNAEHIVQVIHQVLEDPLKAGNSVKKHGRTQERRAKPRLTPRQCEVLDLLCEGLSNKLIAKRLDLSEFTVRGHVQAVLGLLEVTSRAQATVAARSSGLVG
jgi:DNA-binding NarL/FixJ family response regulator